MSHAISLDKVLRARLLPLQLVGQEQELWCWAACSEAVVSYLRSDMSHAFPGLAGKAGPGDLRQGHQLNLQRARRAAAGVTGKDCIDCTRTPKTARQYEACNQPGWPYLHEFEEIVQSTQWSSHRFALEQLGVPLRENGYPRTVIGRLSSQRLRELVAQSGQAFRRRVEDAEDCALSWPMLKSLIDAELPVIFGWRYSGSGGHFMVAAGYVVTPPGERWVVVFDPLPPDCGDAYLIPYDYYVAGPYGRHWRDYWVPRPGAGPAGLLPPSLTIDSLAVGREMVRSSLTVSEGRGVPAKTTAGKWLTDEEAEAALEQAQQGLVALKEIASQAPNLSAAMGMGGAALRMLLKGFFLGYLESEGKSEAVKKVTEKLKPTEVDPDNIVMDKNYIPVFGLTLQELIKWDGKQAKDLLRRAPRQVIFPVRRCDLKLYDFFSTITVQRYDDRWRLASLGRSFLGGAMTLGQLFAVLTGVRESFSGEGKESEGPVRELSFETMLNHLDELDILGALAEVLRGQNLDFLPPEEDPQDADSAATESLTARLSAILGASELDKVALRDLARDADRTKQSGKQSLDVRKPEFVIDVAQLYQQFVAYTDDELEPVYPKSFYPPNRRIVGGDLDNVLRQLKALAGASE